MKYKFLLVAINSHQLVPRALEIAFEEDSEFRQGLPLNYLDYTGITNCESVS